MKLRLTFIMAVLAAVGSSALLGDGTNTIPAVLQWTVTTNWTRAGESRTLMWWSGEGEDPNITTYHENGVISSNLIALITWKGKVNGITLESVPFSSTSRSYTLKTERAYR